MKVLIIGSGGREHAIAWKIKQSDQLTELFVAPGNPGIAAIAECVDIKVDKIDQLLEFAQSKEIDFTIVGPELPLTLGIVDRFQEAGLKVFGPTKAAAELEGSKSFAKEIMQSAAVPTADYQELTSLPDLLEYLKQNPAPIVLKADGLAAGKGVFVCLSDEDAEAAARKLFQDFEAEKVVAEQYLTGVEASFIVATDGENVYSLASSHDYKRINDGDQGPNTGGMGTVSPTPRLSEAQEAVVVDTVIKPVLAEMKKRGSTYQGFLYAGLMISEQGKVNVIEFNARLGDPETQVIMARMQSDFLSFLMDIESGSESVQSDWSNESAVCVVLAAEGYPVNVVKGDEITGINLAEQMPGTIVFQAGTGMQDGKLVTAGGRVLAAVSTGATLEQAIQNTYRASDCIQFRGQQKRRDIGSL